MGSNACLSHDSGSVEQSLPLSPCVPGPGLGAQEAEPSQAQLPLLQELTALGVGHVEHSSVSWGPKRG